VDVEQPHLAFFHPRITVAEVGAAFADAFDLSAEERNAGFERFEDVVVVKRLAIVGNRPVIVLRLRVLGFPRH
jgi:hypothetical protein